MAKTVAERADVIPVLAEIFRENGFEGASLSLIGQKTGLGKGSLYNFFPGGKEEMATAVLQQIDGWFEDVVYRPLREHDDPNAAIADMCTNVSQYFRSGQRVCLVGAFALDNVRDRFADALNAYFRNWHVSLCAALTRAGIDAPSAADLSEDAILSIQGALVLSRALGDLAVFERAMDRIARRLADAPAAPVAPVARG